MAYIERNEIVAALEHAPQLKEYLYRNGFIITNDKLALSEGYPFYANWRFIEVGGFSIYLHCTENAYVYANAGVMHFLIGHAYNPFLMKTDEMDILQDLAHALDNGEETYWECESQLTGVFCIGYITASAITYTTDCAGMQLVYHGVINNKIYITSHSKIVADLLNLRQPEYIQRLVSNKYWHYWGTWLPGDLSPFDELKRMVPNHAGVFELRTATETVHRFYPTEKVIEKNSETDYVNTIHELGRIMSNTMKCIAEKWNGGKVSISVTGGRDSLTALACAKEVYDKLNYFSYISNVDESVDAYAARDILAHLNLKHEIFEIPEQWDGYQYLPEFKLVMECNNGCIGANNANDLKKRLYFTQNPPCDMEVKSWVNEMGRGWYYNKYNKRHFPKYPYASYWRAMHKVYITKYLIEETDKVFSDYLSTYYDKTCFDRISWLELYFWEFAWSGGEGVFLTSEQRVPYDITVPFNNRKYVELMLTVPVEKRIVDDIPIDLIEFMNPMIAETGITVHDISHTSLRAIMVRTYLELFSHVRFGRKREQYK